MINLLINCSGDSEIFLDVCPKAFEIILNFLRSGARKIPPNTNVCTESIGATALYLGEFSILTI